MKILDTFTSNIYVRLREMNYNPKSNSKSVQTNIAKKICKDYCDQVGLGVTFTKTEFIYSGGGENGLIIGLIQYPRFPKSIDKIKFHALEIAKKCMIQLRQERISIVHTDETIMIEREDVESLIEVFKQELKNSPQFDREYQCTFNEL